MVVTEPLSILRIGLVLEVSTTHSSAATQERNLNP